jgi:CxxC motif-containing protein (DUF1111 family)
MRAAVPSLALCLLVSGGNAADPLQSVVGRALFERVWVAAPASTAATDGLGPLFNARSCAACHPGGRGAEVALDPSGAPERPGLVLRLRNDPTYGRQLQTGGIHGQPAEGTLRVTYVDLPPLALAGGERVSLRRPRYNASIALPGGMSPRLAPSLHGVGLLAAVPSAVLEERARRGSRRGPRGRLGAGVLGLRAELPSLREQVAEALMLDLGLSTGLRPSPAGDCTAAQRPCRERVHGDRDPPGVEVSDAILDTLVAYVASLPPPPAARPEPRGEHLFATLGCAACHAPSLPAVSARGEVITITPYTDLLLHDLGVGLADEGDPGQRQWRTAPLWGLGGKPSSLLHDGRARSPIEAILWHGGEAETSRERFRALTPRERAALLAFLAAL